MPLHSATHPAAFAPPTHEPPAKDLLVISANGSGSDNGDSRSFASRFWAKVTKTQRGCWLWTGATSGGGGMQHGQVTWRGRYRTPQKAHRIAWELTRGPIPAGLQVNHHCDIPLCCNPDHLYLGTQFDNMRDASVRGRLTVPRTRKLTLYQRLTIYQTPAHPGIGADLARRYGVSEVCIHFVRQGRFLGSGVWHGTQMAKATLPVGLTDRRRA